jgi:hypothetical protein
MQSKKEKDLLVILDNLEQFTEKLLIQLADESEAGCQRLIELIEEAGKQYKKPIEAHITGWIYYFSRTREPQVKEAVENLKVKSSIERLKILKSLLAEGQWNIGSFNYLLFKELVHSIPGYQPLDEKSLDAAIPRLNVLLKKAVDSYIVQFEVNQRLVDEREKHRKEIQVQNSLDHVHIETDLITAKMLAENQFDKTYFCLDKKDGKWQLLWITPNETLFPLPVNGELLRILDDHTVNRIDELNVVLKKRVQKECLHIRDAFFDKIKVYINPEHPKTHTKLTDEELRVQGITSSFILRGNSGQYTLSWINTLGKVAQVSLNMSPELKKWLFVQQRISDKDIIQLKAYLSTVSTSQALGMQDFKVALQNCLLHRSTVPKQEQHKANPLNLGLFKDLELCIGKHVSKVQQDASSESVKISKPASIRKLNLSQYTAVATLFANHSDESINSKRPALEPIVEQHLKCE